MSFATALLGYLGARNAGRAATDQRKQDMELQRQQQQDEQQYRSQQLAEQRRIDDSNLATQKSESAQTARTRAFETGLTLPKNWAKMTPDQKYDYLGVRHSKALAAGDYDAAKATLDQMNSLPRAGNEFANTQYTLQGKIPLAQAQTAWWKQKHSEVMAQIASRERTANAAQRAAGQRAQLSAQTRLASASMSNDEKTYIAALAGYNAMTGRDENEAFQMAIQQYKAANQNWAQQSKLYQLGIGNDPGPQPTPQQFVINTQPATPQITTIMIPLPDGRMIQAPVVNPRGGGNTTSSEAQQLREHVRDAFHNNIPGAAIVQYVHSQVMNHKISPQDEQAIMREFFGPNPRI